MEPVPEIRPDFVPPYHYIWQEAACEDYGLALYNLNKVGAISQEDEMHQELMKLFFFMKIGNQQEANKMVALIQQKIERMTFSEEVKE